MYDSIIVGSRCLEFEMGSKNVFGGLEDSSLALGFAGRLGQRFRVG